MWTQCHPPSLGSIWLKVLEQMWFQDFQDGLPGDHLGQPNITILAMLNLYVAPMLPIKFRLNPTYGLGGDVVWSILRWLPWQQPWISERNGFSNSDSLRRSHASHQVSAQSDLWFGRCHLKNFELGRHGGHLRYQNRTILAILNLHVATMPPTKFQLNPAFGSGGDVENVKS